MHSRVIMALAAAAALSACASEPQSPQSMSVAVDFGMRNYCGLGTSPAIAARPAIFDSFLAEDGGKQMAHQAA